MSFFFSFWGHWIRWASCYFFGGGGSLRKDHFQVIQWYSMWPFDPRSLEVTNNLWFRAPYPSQKGPQQNCQVLNMTPVELVAQVMFSCKACVPRDRDADTVRVNVTDIEAREVSDLDWLVVSNKIVQIERFFLQQWQSIVGWVNSFLGGGFKQHFLFSPRSLGKWSNLTSIFLRWVWNHHLVEGYVFLTEGAFRQLNNAPKKHKNWRLEPKNGALEDGFPFQLGDF